MPRDLANAYVKIRFSDGTGYAGCGTRLDSEYIVTCAHVLKTANKDVEPSKGDTFSAQMPFLSIDNLELELVEYIAEKAEPLFKDHEDLALLRWKNPPDEKSNSEAEQITQPTISFPAMYTQKGDTIDLYSTKRSDNITGTCKGWSEQGWLTVDTETKSVASGDSGSPVWNSKLGAITGMLVAKQRNNLTCYVMPSWKFSDAFKKYFRCFQSSGKNVDVVHDSEFLRRVEHDIMSDLKQPELFEKLTESYAMDGISDKEVMRDYLIDECTQGNFVDVIQGIEGALYESVNALPDEEGADRKLPRIFKAAEKLLSKLLLFSIKSQWMENFHLNCSDSNNFSIPDFKKNLDLGIQVIISRQAQAYPEFSQGDKGLNAGYIGGMVTGKDKDQAVNLTLKSLCSMVLDNQIIDNPREELDDLNEEIRQKKTHSNQNLRKKYSLIHNDNCDFSREIREEIEQLVPELTWITLKVGEHEDVFLINDTALFRAIRSFFQTLDDLSKNR